MAHNNYTLPPLATDPSELVAPTPTHERVVGWQGRAIACIAALSVTATGGFVYNRPLDSWLRDRSYTSEGLGGIQGTGGTGVIDQGATRFSTRVIIPGHTKRREFPVISWPNKPGDSTPNTSKAKSAKYKLRKLEDGGWAIDWLEAVGESSSYITDPDSLPVPEGKKQDYSDDRAKAGRAAVRIALDGTEFSGVRIKKTTDQDVLSKKPELKKFNKIADDLGYTDAHALTTAVLMGQEYRPKALDAVQKYILDEMGFKLIAHVSKDSSPVLEYVNIGTPATEAPFYNPLPAAWWGQTEAAAAYPTKDARHQHDQIKKGVMPTQDNHSPVARHHRQPGNLNNGGNNGSRGQTNSHPSRPAAKQGLKVGKNS